MPTAEEEMARVQATGLLCKRPVNLMNQGSGIIASRWYKRFFVLKDGFLMYYPESEKKEFERKKCANYHPKGVMPLGDCLITKMAEPDNPHMISIVNELSQERLVVQCDSLGEQDRWIGNLEKAARICYKNAQLGDMLIQQLQVQGARLAEEKQDAYLKLHDEARALSEEKSKSEEMERVMKEMESEKERLEATSNQLQTELKQVSGELEMTANAMKEVELERENLVAQQTQLSTLLSTLEDQKRNTEGQLMEIRTRTMQLEEQNVHLSNEGEQTRAELAEKMKAEQEAKANLEESLQQIENRMQQVLSDKELAEQKVEEQLQMAKVLEEEKILFHREATELEKDLAEVKTQKAMTEVELQEEIKARLRAEERLRSAEQALENLERRINETHTVASDEHRSQLLKNVKALKRYFEEKAIEAKVDADAPVIMKRAVYNKRRNLRAKSMRLIREDLETYEGGDNSSASESPTVRMRNSASNVLKNPQLRTMIAQSVHGDLTF